LKEIDEQSNNNSICAGPVALKKPLELRTLGSSLFTGHSPQKRNRRHVYSASYAVTKVVKIVIAKS
jgi:hypothetical protein